MTDFLDYYRPAPELVTTSRIECDSEGCPAAIIVPGDITESQAASIARTADWSAQMGARRFYFHCERHREVKR